MKQNIIISIICLVLFLTHTSTAHAYGGGSGFPPGHYNNPHVKHKLVCHLVTKKLPHNMEIKIPSCKVVKNEVKNPKTKTVNERFDELRNRILHGK